MISSPEHGAIEFIVIGIAFRVPEEAAHGFDRDRDTLHGPALEIEQAPLDHLFGSECDVGGGLIGVEVEIDPAGTIAGRDGNGAGLLMDR